MCTLWKHFDLNVHNAKDFSFKCAHCGMFLIWMRTLWKHFDLNVHTVETLCSWSVYIRSHRGDEITTGPSTPSSLSFSMNVLQFLIIDEGVKIIINITAISITTTIIPMFPIIITKENWVLISAPDIPTSWFFTGGFKRWSKVQYEQLLSSPCSKLLSQNLKRCWIHHRTFQPHDSF